MHKILGSTTCTDINPTVAKSLKLKEGFSFFAIPNEVLDKFNVKGFDIIDSDNDLMLVAQPQKPEPTNENTPTLSKEVAS